PRGPQPFPTRRSSDLEPFDLGEVSFHLGWTFHRAGANRSQQPRSVMTVIYMDRDMRLKAPENHMQQQDWEKWCAGAVPGEIIDTDRKSTRLNSSHVKI